MKDFFDLMVRGGTVVLPGGERRTDVGIKEGKIAKIGDLKKDGAARVIEARGHVVFPGFIDAHVHLNEPGREDWEGLETGTRALAAGGVTTFFDMPLNSTPPVVTAVELEKKRRLALRKSRVDFGLWGGLVPGNVRELKGMAEAGAVGFKAFMCGSGMEDFPAADLKTLEAGAREAARLGKVLAVHAEDDAMTSRLTEELCLAGKTSWKDYLKSRPVEAEMKAVREVLDIAARTGCRLHLVHVSCPKVLALAASARRKGVDVTAETCPHYLFFDGGALKRIGGLAKCSPPLREQDDVRGMWEMLARGRLATVGSDHSPCPSFLKGGRDFFKIWGGISGCQHAMPLWIGEAKQRGMGLGRMAALAAGNAADRFGLSGKGRLRVGWDADLAILRFGKGEVIVARKLLYRHRYSLFAGMTPRATMGWTVVRGTVVYEASSVLKTPGFRGQEVCMDKGTK